MVVNMEFGVIKYWLKESSILLFIMYMTWIIMGAVIMSFDKNTDFMMSGIMGFCPLFSSFYIGNKVRTYSCFGFSRKQYLKNIIIYNLFVAAELAVISIVITKIMLVIYKDKMSEVSPLDGLSILSQFVVLLFVFNFCYATIFFDSSVKLPVITSLFGSNGVFNTNGKRTTVSLTRKVVAFVCYLVWFMVMFMILGFYRGEIKVGNGGYIISGVHAVSLLVLVVLTALVYYFGFRRLRKKEYV